MTPQPRRIPDVLLERYLTDSLDAEQRSRLEAALADAPQERARLEALRADSAAFLIRNPPGPLVAKLREPRRRWWRSWPALLVEGLAVVAAASLLFALQGESLLQLFRDDPEFNVKGSVVLVLYRKAGNSGVPVAPGGMLAPQDVLRFEVKAAASGFVAVLSRDGRGIASVYHPFEGAEAAAYDTHQPVLPGAVELDDTLGHEDVYALYSPHPFELMWAVEALRQGRLVEEAASRHISVGHVSFEKMLIRRKPQK
jgi:hypothetical protein